MFEVQAVARVAVLLMLTGNCACSILPTSGPASSDVRKGTQDPESVPYALVRITSSVEKVLASKSPTIGRIFPERGRPAEIRFGVGDTVSVTIFEAAAGGLFIPLEAGVRPGNYITLPTQQVDNNGNITVPYAGTITVRGRTVVEVQTAIVDALKNRALEPQVVVTMVDQRASSVTVVGDVGSQRLAVNPSGERLLDVIARAGGPRNASYDTWVMLERGGRRATGPFASIVNDPANNVWIKPQDTIFLYTLPLTFTAFGGSGAQGLVPFGNWRLSLAEALAKLNGLNDSLADPAAVFLYRGEPREVAEQLGVDCSRFAGPVIPIVYNLNLRDPSGFFLASNFEMQNKDVVYTSNSFSVESTKFISYLRLLISAAEEPINAISLGASLKTVLHGGGAVTTIVTPPAITTTP